MRRAEEPSNPRRVRADTWRHILRRTAREFGFHDLPDAAAALTYYGVLALFPALMAAVAAFVMLGEGRRSIDVVFDGFESAFPGVSTEGLRDALDELARGSGSWALTLGAALTVWAVSRYVGAFSRAMNRIYQVDEGRPLRVRAPLQVLVAIAVIVIVATMAGCVLLSGPIADALAAQWRIGEPWPTVWSVARWPLAIVMAIVLIGLLYYATPNAHQRRFRWLSLGAATALATLAAASALFFVYAANFAHYERVYRSLAGALIVLIWMWIANLAVLFGAEFDAQVERGRQLQAGIAAEETLQLRMRDTRLRAKRAGIRSRLVDDARQVRYRSAPHR